LHRHLKILKDGVVLKSQANLIASRKIRLPKEDRATLNEICSRIRESL